MQIEAALLTPAGVATTTLAATCLTVGAYLVAPWSSWLARGDRQHVWLATLVLLLVIGSMRAGITPGLSLQFGLATTLTLMHGAPLALFGIAAVYGADCAWAQYAAGGPEAWNAWGANTLCYGALPVAFVAALRELVQRRLPHNYFVYFFVTVFAGSLLASLLAGGARLALLAANGTLPAAQVGPEFLAYAPMLAFAEAFVNGALLAVAVAFRPEWVASFDDRLYLSR